ncbi:ANTAR domain-containing protein [Streptomyces sp. VRA16 Mangrove soil]|uniref:ANTAR domain-containing protein n=1 Tax=Streptomyces sp. VRA16 Mangrove soil TaxID=2817434 RepID=UPI0027DDD68D|nr:ANTAR domain-containing protein [Streptomyces sp. VRA16 Mangrove soil]
MTDLARAHERLNVEVEDLRRAVPSRAVIDQAIGVVIAISQLSAEESFGVLREVSQRSNVKIREASAHLVAFARGEAMPEAERAELDRALARCAAAPEPRTDRRRPDSPAG